MSYNSPHSIGDGVNLDEKDPSTSFTIISSDNISLFGKPNAIVRPLRRSELIENLASLASIESQIVTGHGFGQSDVCNNEQLQQNDIKKESTKKKRTSSKEKALKNVNFLIFCVKFVGSC